MMQGKAALSSERTRKASPRKSRKPDRDAIVEEFLPSIRIHAARLKMRIPPHIETDDLVSSGVVGLLDALNRYDESRGIKFKTYAEFRIRGAMLDYLREMDWSPGRRARTPPGCSTPIPGSKTCSEGLPRKKVAEDLGISVDELRKQLAAFMGMTVFSLDALQDEDEDCGAGWRHVIAEAAMNESREEELTRELKDVLGKAMDIAPRARTAADRALLSRGPDPAGDQPDLRAGRAPGVPAPRTGGLKAEGKDQTVTSGRRRPFVLRWSDRFHGGVRPCRFRKGWPSTA